MSNRTPQSGAPSAYAAEKLPMLQARMALLRPLLERFVSIAFPGCDPVGMVFALMGFTAFSTGWREDTTDADLLQQFRELGLFQVPAGSRSGPSPNRTGNAAYCGLAEGPLVLAMLGRHASTQEFAWRPSAANDSSEHDVRAREEQVAVGLANLRQDEATLRAKMEHFAPGSAGDAGTWSVWRVFCMFTAMSRGPAAAFARLQPYLHALAEVHESVRLHALFEAVDRGILSHDPHAVDTWTDGVCYAIARSIQKLYSGMLLAQRSGVSTTFFDDARMLSTEAETRLSSVAYTRRASDLAIDAARSSVATVQTAAGAFVASPASTKAFVIVGVIALGSTVLAASVISRS